MWEDVFKLSTFKLWEPRQTQFALGYSLFGDWLRGSFKGTQWRLFPSLNRRILLHETQGLGGQVWGDILGF